MKNLSLLSLLTLCLTFTMFSCSEEPIEEPEMMEEEMEEEIDFTLYPAVGIGSLKIGDPGSEVEKQLGEGFVRIVNEGSSGNATYNYFNDPAGIDIIFGQYGSADLDHDTLPIDYFYLFDSFRGKTEEGIGIGSTKAEVIEAYGEPNEENEWETIYYIGMVIFYNDEDKIRSMLIVQV